MAFDLSKLSSFFKTQGAVKEGVIGIDIGSSSIKVVQLSVKDGTPTLETYGELQLGSYSNTDLSRPVRLPVDKLMGALKDILREAGVTTNGAVVAISYNSSFTTLLSVPEDDPEKVKAMIPVEARKYVPVPLSEVTVDWFPVAARPVEKTTKVLLAAIHNEALNRYDSLMKGLNLVQLGQEIEIFSTIRSVTGGESGTVGIIDFGAGSTKFFLVHGGTLCNTHSISLNGAELTNTIARIKNISFSQAEEEKRSKGFAVAEGNPELEKALHTLLERGFREIHSIMKEHEATEGAKIEKIILTGGSALLNGLVPYAKDTFSCPAELANPFSKVAYPAFLEDTLTEAGPSFAVAVGTGLFGLSL